ncbi:type II toxin-antitoxin system VapC family toxin [uncultured Mucilaginibacter sp.]|uniref:type II toxin-antitoxin system VapC family toxin n=1 Tax=uncultured Mucilaginibacter sp. TaxID=797541 RepID=UPI0025D3ADB2|nr:type II toxin-antitoxin system VapC family toxin [uncultured Mucilaginibacter sp.]
MEQPQYLVDTNAIIDYLGQKLPIEGVQFMNEVIDAIPNVSVISKIELLGFNAPDQYYQLLVGLMNDAVVLDLTSEIVDISIDIRKKHRTKLPDAVIAATAIFYKFTLISRNISDFKNIKGLKVVNPYSI